MRHCRVHASSRGGVLHGFRMHLCCRSRLPSTGRFVQRTCFRLHTDIVSSVAANWSLLCLRELHDPDGCSVSRPREFLRRAWKYLRAGDLLTPLCLLLSWVRVPDRLILAGLLERRRHPLRPVHLRPATLLPRAGCLIGSPRPSVSSRILGRVYRGSHASWNDRLPVETEWSSVGQ